MSTKNQATVFLSYSAKDSPWVSKFSVALKEASSKPDIKVLNAAEMKPGAALADSIKQALLKSTFLITILSSKSIKNPWIHFEIGAAIANHKKIIPVQIGDIEKREIPSYLRNLVFLKETSPKKAGMLVAETIIELKNIGEK
jgi:hypothetical protein